MALQKVSPGLLPAENYRRFNSAFDAIDKNDLRIERAQAAADSKASWQDLVPVREALNRLAFDVANRATASDLVALRSSLSTDISRVIASVADLKGTLSEADYEIASQSTSRPGDGPMVFTRGLPPSAAPLSPSAIAIGDNGRVARIVGSGIIARRLPVPLERGRIKRLRYAIQRRANVSDPSGDAVEMGVAWHDQAMNPLSISGRSVVRLFDNLRTSDGRQERSITIGRPGMLGALLQAPLGAVYAVPYVRLYGTDGVTDVEVIDATDISDLVAVPDIAADALARIQALESDNPGERLDILEASAQNPNSQTYGTRSSAAAASIPPSVTTVVTRGRDAPGDGRDGLYSRIAGPLPTGADGFTAANGSIWVRVQVAQDIFDLLVNSRVKAYLEPDLSIFRRASDAVKLVYLGWRGDGTNRTLGDIYQTIAQAQVVFPSAQSLSEYVDGCALERVIQQNAIYFGRSSIQVPAGGTRVSRTIDTTGIEVFFEGCGPSSMIIGMGPGPVIRHGIGERLATPSDPPNRPFRMQSLRIDQEGPVTGSCALDISYYDDAGIWYATKILDVDFRGFQYPIRMRNPGRGWQMERCGFYGPDFTTMPNGAVTVVTDSYARHGSAQLTATANKFANYRWGFEIDMQPPFAAYGQSVKDSRRSLEDVALMFNTAQNGWGFLKVNCNQKEVGYSSLLWTLLNNDWQGAGHGLWMRNCNKIEVRGGFWIGNQKKPAGDENDPFNGGDKDPLTGLPERRYMSFYLCEDIDIEGCRIDVPGDYDSSCLIHIDGTKNANVDKLKVRAGNVSMNAGVRMVGLDENTIREFDTAWTIWSSSTNNKVVDVNGNQISQTVVTPYGTVDRTGEYVLRGLTGTLTVPPEPEKGYKLRVEYPRRLPVPGLNGGQPVPFFLANTIGDPFSPYVLVAARAAGYVPAPTITGSDAFGFEVTFPNTMGGSQVQLEYQVRGR